MKRLLLLLIVGYQRTLSPDHGFGRLWYPQAGCRYYPSCSEYVRQSVMKHGVLRGGCDGLKRLLRCHPLASGGLDPVR